MLTLVIVVMCPAWVSAKDDDSSGDRKLGSYEGLLPFGVRGVKVALSDRERKNFGQVRDTVDKALRWLACHQDPGGVFDVGDLSWADGKRIAELPGTVKRAHFVTPVHALVLCAFLGSGYGPSGDHAFAEPIRKGLDALARLLRVGERRDGKRYANRRDPTYTLACAFGLRAFAEAFAATGDERYRTLASEVLRACLDARTAYIGWGYAYQDPRGETFLTSCMAFGFDAVLTTNRAALMAGLKRPLHVPTAGALLGEQEALEGAADWFLRVTDPRTSAVGYSKQGEAGTTTVAAGRPEATSALAALAMAEWFWQRRWPLGRECPKGNRRSWRKRILSSPPGWRTAEATHDLIEWWFVAMACAADRGGRAAKWRRALERQLIDNQVSEGDKRGLRGSWDPTGKWGFASGRVGTTALSVLCLVAPQLTPVVGDPAKRVSGKRDDLDPKLLRRPLRPEVRADLLLALARFRCDGARAAAQDHLNHASPSARRAARLALKHVEATR